MVAQASHPTDWVTLPISAIVRNLIDHRGRTPRKLGTKWGGDIPALSANNVKMGYIDLEEGIHYGTEALYERWMTNGKTVQGDLIITVEAPLGNVALIPDNRKYIVSQRTVVLQTRPDLVVNEYLLHFMMSEHFQGVLQKNSTGSTAIGIRRRKFETLEVMLPPIPEQRAIAAALNDADALIETLQQLLTKKHQVKQGAIQELVMGKRRLPEFVKKGEYKQTEFGVVPEGWDVTSIQELIDSNAIVGHLDGNHGALYPRSHEFVEHGVPYITANELTGYKVSFRTCKYLSKERARRFRKGVAINGDVLFAHNATVGPTALLATELDYVILSTTATYFRCNPEKIINSFLLYSLQSQYFVSQYQAIMAQSTRNQVPITAQRKLFLVVPPPPEQTAIAEILSDMDAEISALEEKLVKARQVKAGMMSELLTGKIRLV